MQTALNSQANSTTKFSWVSSSFLLSELSASLSLKFVVGLIDQVAKMHIGCMRQDFTNATRILVYSFFYFLAFFQLALYIVVSNMFYT